MPQNAYETQAKIGDWIEVGGPPGTLPRRGQILAVLGAAGHTHFRIRWDEEHESLFYPTEGVTIVHPIARPAHKPTDDKAGM